MKSLFLISLLFLSGLAVAQPKLKLYAYSQAFTPGTIPVDISEEGKGQPESRVHTNYYIYISVPAGTTVTPTQMQLNGKWYKLLNPEKPVLPVYSDYPEKKLLVPRTLNQVFQLLTADSCSPPSTINISKALSKSEIIVVYTYKNRIYSIGKTKFTVLPPVHGL
jgi:hypothetical protein